MLLIHLANYFSMEAPSTAQVFIVHGMHITENLEHHKASDVARILEDKGFEQNSDEARQRISHYRLAGTPETGKHTRISFDAQGFVMKDAGVEYL
jgi:hypothetical protein